MQAMAETIRHRGPDDAGVWTDPQARVALGFCRLAVLDLSAAGHQPMSSSRGRWMLVFNGEIYNHPDLRARLDTESAAVAWRGHSDTETLLACIEAWGVRKTLERAVGMFALALWDRRDRRLYLARDRFGEKPLYYGWTTGGFAFASELAAVRRAPGFDATVDRDVLALYMRYRYVPAPYAIFRSTYKLEPGCILSMSPADAACPPQRALVAPARQGELTIEPYWSAAEMATRGVRDPIADDDAALASLEATLGDAVRSQLIADVPLGAFLSGGIDSSMIVALMQAHSPQPVRTFTIGFEEAAFNEAAYARRVAAHLQTEHHELYVTASEARGVIPNLAAMYSEPFADSSQVPAHLVSRFARSQVTVALTGDGGDELLGGYNRHVFADRMWTHLRRVPPVAYRGVSRVVGAVPVSTWDALGHALPRRRRIAHLGDKAHKLAHRLRPVRSVREFHEMVATTAWGGSDVVPGARELPLPIQHAVAADTLEVAEQMMLLDTATYLPDDILHKVDRAAMHVSLETRAPFLDHRVGELAWRLPLHMKIRHGQGKWILRQLLAKYVPVDLIERPKVGFHIPLDLWLRGPLREWASDLLAPARLLQDGYLDAGAVQRKWAEHLSGRRDWQDELWCVLMFQTWLTGAQS